MDAAHTLFLYVQQHRPDLHQEILHLIRPHSLKSVLSFFQEHLEHSVPDLTIFNKHSANIPIFCLEFVKAIRKNFPQPGDAYGIQLTCRITRSDTQGTLDSKHLRSSLHDGPSSYNVSKELLYELNLFTTQSQVFELAMRHQYSTVFVDGYDLKELWERLPEAGYLRRGGDFNKAENRQGQHVYVNTFQYVLVQDQRGVRILYQSAAQLTELLQRLDMRKVVAFSDIRSLLKQCGVVCHFFNMVQLLRRQLFTNVDSVYEKDVLAVCKYQCRSGQALPLTREGLAKNQERSPIEVLSFEAPKKNYARLCTGPERTTQYGVTTSADKIFFGQQFNEGTGSGFALLPQEESLRKKCKTFR